MLAGNVCTTASRPGAASGDIAGNGRVCATAGGGAANGPMIKPAAKTASDARFRNLVPVR